MIIFPESLKTAIRSQEDYLIEIPRELAPNEFFINFTNIIVKREQRLEDIRREKLNRKGIWCK